MTNLCATAKSASGNARTERDDHLARLVGTEWFLPAGITGVLSSMVCHALSGPDRGEGS